MNRDVFISYSRKNYDTVMEIKRQIDSATGAECWIDLKGIESGSDLFIKDIIGGIDNCKVFLFMLSKESQQSEYALLELNYAKMKNKRVVLVNIDDGMMEGVFLFKYSLTDTIAWNNQPQRDKLIRDLCNWIGSTINPKITGKAPTSESKLITEKNSTPVSEPIKSAALHRPFGSLNDLEVYLAKLEREIGELECFQDSSGKYGYKDETGKVVIPNKWDDADCFREGLAGVQDSNGKWGFIDKIGELVVPCHWDEIGSFYEGLAMVMNANEKYGYINKTGNLVIPCQWEDAYWFCEGVAEVVDSNGKKCIIDKTGKVITSTDPLRELEEHLAKLDEEVGELFCFHNHDYTKYGYLDKNGKQIIPYQWDEAGDFSEGLARVKGSNGKWGFIDKTGKLVIPCRLNGTGDFSEGLASVRDVDFRWGAIDKTGTLVIRYLWDEKFVFSEGLASVQDASSGKYGFIDKTGQLVIPCQWDDVGDFSEGLAMVENSNSQCGYVDKNGNVVIPCQFNSAGPFKEGWSLVENSDEEWVKIDKSGKQFAVNTFPKSSKEIS